MTQRLLPLIVILCLTSPALAQPRWPQFRGQNAQGVADDQHPPTDFGPSKNLLWKTPLPPGHSSPCIWNDRIFLTACGKNQLETLCLNRADGKILWRQTAPSDTLEKINRTNTLATPTPTTDGKFVYVFFGSIGLLAYNFDGELQWRTPLPIVNVRHGVAASPILAAGRLIANCDQEDGKSFLIALDPATGKTLWRAPRPKFWSSHSTPIVWSRDGVDEIVLAGCIRLVAYDPANGAERWSCRGIEAVSICPTPALGDGMLFAASRSMGEQRLPTFDASLAKLDKNHDGKIARNEADTLVGGLFSILDANNDGLITREEWDANFNTFQLADHGLFALRPPGPGADAGDITQTHVAWKDRKNAPDVTSPLFYRGRLFTIRDGGLASCFDAKTGQPLYTSQRIGAVGQYFASPVAANGKIYLASMLGAITVLQASDTLKVLSRTDLDAPIASTPAIADHKLYIRTSTHLYAFGQ